jgi:hypothetical protein
MAQLYLPVAHTEADLVLAGQIAERIASAELYVAWTPELGGVAPEVVAELRRPPPSWTDALGPVFQVMRELWSALLGRDHRARLAPAPAAEQPARSRPAAGEAAA